MQFKVVRMVCTAPSRADPTSSRELGRGRPPSRPSAGRAEAGSGARCRLGRVRATPRARCKSSHRARAVCSANQLCAHAGRTPWAAWLAGAAGVKVLCCLTALRGRRPHRGGCRPAAAAARRGFRRRSRCGSMPVQCAGGGANRVCACVFELFQWSQCVSWRPLSMRRRGKALFILVR